MTCNQSIQYAQQAVPDCSFATAADAGRYMSSRTLFCIFNIFLIFGVVNMAQAEETWSIGKLHVKGMPVIYKFLTHLPDKEVTSKLKWLAVISWKYDGSNNNGMPTKEINDLMIELEDGLEEVKGSGKIYLPVYAATGNNVKEFVFYISDRDLFLEQLNNSLTQHQSYPIEITFYKDEDWTELSELLNDFGKN